MEFSYCMPIMIVYVCVRWLIQPPTLNTVLTKTKLSQHYTRQKDAIMSKGNKDEAVLVHYLQGNAPKLIPYTNIDIHV